MSTKKTSAQDIRRYQAAVKRHRKDLVYLVKFVNRITRQMAAGEQYAIIVNVLDLKGNSIAIQTVAGNPHPPTPPGPPNIPALRVLGNR
jgi:hypothetical protein